MPKEWAYHTIPYMGPGPGLAPTPSHGSQASVKQVQRVHGSTKTGFRQDHIYMDPRNSTYMKSMDPF